VILQPIDGVRTCVSRCSSPCSSHCSLLSVYHPSNPVRTRMKHSLRSNKGFTLVEIMIVVVIIGLLAAMAIPAFQKVRRSSIEKTIVNDGRIIGASLQQAFMETGIDTLDLTFTDPGTAGLPVTWAVTGGGLVLGESAFNGTLSKGVLPVGGFGTNAIDITTPDVAQFGLRHPQYLNDNWSGLATAKAGTDGLQFNLEGQPAP
jgi:type IV pilus assembly protein PilA